MQTPLRYILFGAHPFWCKVTLPYLQSIGKATCAAVVEPDPLRADIARQRLGLGADRVFTDALQALQECPANFAAITTSGDQHERLIDACLTFDLNLLVEPPLAEDMRAAARIYRKVRDIGKRFVVVSGSAFEPDKQTLLQALGERELGRVNYVSLRFAQNFRKEKSWGYHRHMMNNPLLVEAAMQHFDLFRLAAGANARNVFASSWNTLWGQFKGDTNAMVLFEMENGVHCSYEGTVVAAGSSHPWGRELVRVECERASLELEDGRLRSSAGEALDHPRTEEVTVAEREIAGHTWLAERFCDWCHKCPTLPPTHLKEHIQTVAMVFAAMESAETGKPVEVQRFLQDHLTAAKRQVRAEKANGEADSAMPGELPV